MNNDILAIATGSFKDLLTFYMARKVFNSSELDIIFESWKKIVIDHLSEKFDLLEIQSNLDDLEKNMKEIISKSSIRVAPPKPIYSYEMENNK